MILNDENISWVVGLLERTSDTSASKSETISRFGFIEIRPHLISLLGTGGFRMLISHALTQSQCEARWLSDVRSKGDGTFEGLNEAYEKTSPEIFRGGPGIILTNVLILLVQYIGLDMTNAIIQRTWPLALPFSAASDGADR